MVAEQDSSGKSVEHGNWKRFLKSAISLKNDFWSCMLLKLMKESSGIDRTQKN